MHLDLCHRLKALQVKSVSAWTSFKLLSEFSPCAPGDLLAKPLYQRVEGRQTAAGCEGSQLRSGAVQSVPLCGAHCQPSSETSPIVPDFYDSLKPQIHE